MSHEFALKSLADTVEIAPGIQMPRLGLGTYKAAEGPDVAREVSCGLSLGYRLIDTAAIYGNEISIGKVLQESEVAREDLFLTTKLWNSDQGFEPALAAFERSLSRLDVDYVDLYLVHWPWPQHMRETWRAMEQILDSGRARAIGVCNHLPHHLAELVGSATVMPAVNQFEFHPRLQQLELAEACRQFGVTIQSWAPLMRGHVNDIPLLIAIAEGHNKTPAQVSIRWVLQKGITTIPKSVQEPRIAENCAVYDFELSEDEMMAIDALDTGHRLGPDPDVFAPMGGVPSSMNRT